MSPELASEQAAVSLEIEGDGVAWIVFDNHGERPNILSAEVMRRLDELLDDASEAVSTGRARALVIRSGKAGSFIAGADVREIGGIEDAAVGEAGARTGQQIFLRLDRLPMPTVAAVDGVCLGGGTELILACDYRLASDRPETRIGLPEVKLGIIPGFGGTTRLPRLVGTRAALDLILTGKTLDARRAARVGLIHERLHPAQLYDRARAAALELAEGKRAPAASRKVMERLLDDTGPGRKLVLSRARKQVLKETRGHYPAPLAALKVIEESQGKSLETALAIEARALGRLVVTPESRNLIHVFQLLEGAKKAAPRVPARRVTRAAVLGAGVMGGGIAHLLAGAGVTVRLKDIQAEALASGLRHARGLFEHAVKRRRLRPRELQRNLNRIAPTLAYTGFGSIELVIEAVVERMDVKQQVLREVEAVVGPECILTSNTSSLSITAMQRGLARPDGFCGMHFFNPVHRMPLVEVIRGEQTSDETVATVFAFARSLGKTPVVVRDGPGFLVNRILAPYLNEAGWLLADGGAIEQVDEVLLDFGMPMGPLRLLDEIGLDVARHAGQVMTAAFGDRLAPPPPLLALENSPRLLGKKTGAGFYRYDGEKQGDVNAAIYGALGATVPGTRRPLPPESIRQRTVLAMVNEAARVLSDGIAARAADVDVAMITGTGFPPFRGGLLRHADALGAGAVVAALEQLQQLHGARFEPSPLLRELAARGGSFYGG